MGNDGFDDDFYKIFKKYKLDFMDELNLREEVQSYTKKRFVSKDKMKGKIEYLDNQQRQWLEDRELKNSDEEICFARDFLIKLLKEEK